VKEHEDSSLRRREKEQNEQMMKQENPVTQAVNQNLFLEDLNRVQTRL
jgi:hypothetical protein